jgi:predicted nucleotidyltransferase
VIDRLRQVLSSDSRIAYALLFGSRARGTPRPDSDLDLAVGLARRMEPLELGELVGKLESATGRTVDLVLLDEAPPALAYRVFRDGEVVCDRDPAAFASRKARAILEYLDFKPIEELCARGVLAAARHGR